MGTWGAVCRCVRTANREGGASVKNAGDESVDTLGMMVESRHAIHRGCGWRWGCVVDAVDRRWKLSAAIHNPRADIPVLRSVYPRQPSWWMGCRQPCAPRHIQYRDSPAEGAPSGYPHYPPALILRTTILLFIHIRERKEERATADRELSTAIRLSPGACGLWRTLLRYQLPAWREISSASRITARGASRPVHRVNDSAP